MSHSFRQKVFVVLGKLLRDLRLERGLTLADIALHADVSVETIRHIENGTKTGYDKYKSLLNFYHKKFEIVLKDEK